MSAARPGLFRSSLLVAAVTLATKLTGFLRVTTITARLGATAYTDAFLTAFLVPESLYVFLTEGAITAAFVPPFTRALSEGPGSFAHLVTATLARVTALGAIAGVALALFAEPITGLIAPRFAHDTSVLTAELLRLIAGYVPLTAAASVAFAACNARGRFLAPALGPLLFNLAIIASVYFSNPRSVHPLVCGVLLGGLFQLLLQIRPMGEGIPWRARAAVEPHPGLPEIGRLLGPLTFSLGVTQVQILGERMLASGLADGVITSMNLVQKLVNLPLGLVGMAVAAPLMPALARHDAAGDAQRFAGELARALLAAVAAIAPLSAVCLVAPTEVVEVLFKRGAFGAEQVTGAARMLWHYAFGLPAVSVTFLITGAFLAQGVATTPALVRAVLLTANILLNWAWLDAMQVAGIPLAWSLMYIANALVLLALAARRHPSLGGARVLGSAAAVSLASVAAATLVGALWPAIAASRLVAIARLAAIGGAAAAASAATFLAVRPAGEGS